MLHGIAVTVHGLCMLHGVAVTVQGICTLYRADADGKHDRE